jgi:hypothetical protein
LRHLLMTNLTYKKEAMKMIKVANTNTQRLIKRIDKSLKK